MGLSVLEIVTQKIASRLKFLELGITRRKRMVQTMRVIGNCTAETDQIETTCKEEDKQSRKILQKGLNTTTEIRVQKNFAGGYGEMHLT